MTEESGRREKIIQLVKDLTLCSSSDEYKVPTVVGDFILQGYGLSSKANGENVPDSEMTELVSKIEGLIIEKRESLKREYHEPRRTGTNGEHNFKKACDAFIKAKNGYFQVCLEFMSLLDEINQFRVRYSNHLKEKAAVKQGELELMEKKIKFLKGESLLKLYSERNALAAHLKLMEILTEKLKKLELDYDNLVELDARYNELKSNKAYCDLLSTYKQLLTREKKLDYMMES